MTRDELLSIAKPILFNTEMVRAILDGSKTVTRRCVKPKSKNAYGFFVLTNKSDGTFADVYDYDEDENAFDKPQKQPAYKGDILYVRETWKRFCGMIYGWENGTYIPLDDVEGYQYKADEQYICTKGINPFCDAFADQKCDINLDDKWKPSIHMPKEAARIFLRVTDVRVEQLQDMTEDDAYKEGWNGPWCAHKEFENYPDTPIPCEAAANPNCPIDPPCKKSIPELFGSDIWDKTIKKSGLDQYGWAANPWVWVIEFERLEVSE